MKTIPNYPKPSPKGLFETPIGDVSRTIPFFSTPFQFVTYFLGMNIIVESFGVVIEGKLLHYRMGKKEGHIPDLLILKNNHGVHLIRNWSIIKTPSAWKVIRCRE